MKEIGITAVQKWRKLGLGLIMGTGTMTTMLNQKARMIMTATENPNVIMMAMIGWMRMAMIIIELHLSRVIRMIGVQRGRILVSMMSIECKFRWANDAVIELVGSS